MQQFTFGFILILVLKICIQSGAEKISDSRLCADRICETLISTARALARHKSTDPAFLSFERGDTINIYSKHAGSRQDLWGGELKGKKGYFPRSFVRELRVVIPNPQYTVETEPHIPIEERVGKRRQENKPPPTARTVKRHNEQNSDQPQQQTQEQERQQQQQHEQKNTETPSRDQQAVPEEPPSATQSLNESPTEIVDETEIGDETEIMDTDEDSQSKDAANAEQKTLAEQDTDKRDDQTREDGNRQDESAKVRESDLGSENTKEAGDELAKERQEPDETDIGDETEIGDEEENSDSQEESKQDEVIEKRKVDTSTPSEDQEIHDPKANSRDDSSEQTSDQEQSKDQFKDDDTGSVTDETEVEEKDDTEVTDEEEEEDEGTMFGSIWSDGEEGKNTEKEHADAVGFNTENNNSNVSIPQNGNNMEHKTLGDGENINIEHPSLGSGNQNDMKHSNENNNKESEKTTIQNDDDNGDSSFENTDVGKKAVNEDSVKEEIDTGDVYQEGNTEDSSESGLPVSEEAIAGSTNGAKTGKDGKDSSPVTEQETKQLGEKPLSDATAADNDISSTQDDVLDSQHSKDEKPDTEQSDKSQEAVNIKEYENSEADGSIKDNKDLTDDSKLSNNQQNQDRLDRTYSGNEKPEHEGKQAELKPKNNNHHLKDILKSSLGQNENIHEYMLEHSFQNTDSVIIDDDPFLSEKFTIHDPVSKTRLPNKNGHGSDQILNKNFEGMKSENDHDSKNGIENNQGYEQTRETVKTAELNEHENIQDRLKEHNEHTSNETAAEHMNTLSENKDTGPGDNPVVETGKLGIDTSGRGDDTTDGTNDTVKTKEEDIQHEEEVGHDNTDKGHPEEADTESETRRATQQPETKNSNIEEYLTQNKMQDYRVEGSSLEDPLSDKKPTDEKITISDELAANLDAGHDFDIDVPEAVTSPFKSKTEDVTPDKGAKGIVDKPEAETENKDEKTEDYTEMNKSGDKVPEADTRTEESTDKTEQEFKDKPKEKEPENAGETTDTDDTDTIKTEIEVNKPKQGDAVSEEVLKKLENFTETAAEQKGRTDSLSEETGSDVLVEIVEEKFSDDDLKFVDEQGEPVSDLQETRQTGVKEMNVEPEEKETVSLQTENTEKQQDTESLKKDEVQTSETVSVSQASVTESSVPDQPEMKTSSVDSAAVDMQGTAGIDKQEHVIGTAAETSQQQIETESTLIHGTALEVEPTPVLSDTKQAFVVEGTTFYINDETSNIPPTSESGKTVIDGTTFYDNEFYGNEPTQNIHQNTQYIEPTTTVATEDVITQTDAVAATASSVHEEMPQTMTADMLSVDKTVDGTTYNTLPPLSETLTGHSDVEMKATKIVTEDVTNIESGKANDKVEILGTSFSVVTPTVDETMTIPLDTNTLTMETVQTQNNETVASNNVQEQVQPSLDQDVYKTDAFLSRKPLSSDPETTGAQTETKFDGNDIRTDTPQNLEKQESEQREKLDINNNAEQLDVNNNARWSIFGDNKATTETDFPTTTQTAEEEMPYESGDHVNMRKVPDPLLDETSQTGEPLMKTLEPYLKALVNMLPPSLQSMLEQEPLGLSPGLTMLVSVISTNVLALLTCLGCVFKGKKKPGKKDPLEVIHALEEKLFISTKEKENLEDDLQVKNKRIEELEQEVNLQQSTTGTVETDLKTVKLHTESLKKQVSELQEELEEARQEVSEQSRLISVRDADISGLQSDVESLTQRAQDAEMALQRTSQSLTEKEEDLRTSLSQVQLLSEQIQHLETRKQQLEQEAGDWSDKVKDLEERVEQLSEEGKRMQEDLAFKENEIEVLRDCFLQVKAFQGEEENKEAEQAPDLTEKLKQMMDVSRVNASLRAVEEEKDVIQNKLLIEVDSRKELEDQVAVLKRRVESQQTDKMKAERQCQEAQTKLEVLSKYFKEKEAELTRQLGEQEVLKNQNISKLQSTDTYTQELKKENENYRQQIEDLKTEISKAERDFRSQIAANEKKAHENWLATRAAERELKESRHECGMLRQKLTDLERKLMQGPPPGLIRPITHRAMPPPGMMNGPPPPPPQQDRPGSRGEDDYRGSPLSPDRMPPPPDRRGMPHGPPPMGPMGPRPPPPHLGATSPPPYAIRPPFPPDRRSPPPFDRYPPPPRGARPPYPRPPPPHLRSPPPGSGHSEHDDSRQGQVSPYSRDRGSTRHQSQV